MRSSLGTFNDVTTSTCLKLNQKELHLLRQLPAHLGFNFELTDFQFNNFGLPSRLKIALHICPADSKLQGEGIEGPRTSSAKKIKPWLTILKGCKVSWMPCCISYTGRALQVKVQTLVHPKCRLWTGKCLLSSATGEVCQGAAFTDSYRFYGCIYHTHVWKRRRLFSLLPPRHVHHHHPQWGFYNFSHKRQMCKEMSNCKYYI